jgi:hypothetical protein
MARKHWSRSVTSSLHAMKKKSPAQLDREIAEALSRISRRSHSTKAIKIALSPIYVRTR